MRDSLSLPTLTCRGPLLASIIVCLAGRKETVSGVEEEREEDTAAAVDVDYAMRGIQLVAFVFALKAMMMAPIVEG